MASYKKNTITPVSTTVFTKVNESTESKNTSWSRTDYSKTTPVAQNVDDDDGFTSVVRKSKSKSKPTEYRSSSSSSSSSYSSGYGRDDSRNNSRNTNYRSASAGQTSQTRSTKPYDPNRALRSYVCKKAEAGEFLEIFANPGRFVQDQMDRYKLDEETVRAVLLERAIMQPASSDLTEQIMDFFEDMPLPQTCFRGCIYHPIDSANWNPTIDSEYERIVKFFFNKGFSVTSNNFKNESRIESILEAFNKKYITAANMYHRLDTIANCITRDHISRLVPFAINKISDKQNISLITELFFCYIKYPEIVIKQFCNMLLSRKTTTNIDSDTRARDYITVINTIDKMRNGEVEYSNPAYDQFINKRLVNIIGDPVIEFAAELKKTFIELQQKSDSKPDFDASGKPIDNYITCETLLYAQACGTLTTFGVYENFDEILENPAILVSSKLDKKDGRELKLLAVMVSQVPSTMAFYRMCASVMEQLLESDLSIDRFCGETLYNKFNVPKPLPKTVVTKCDYGDEIISAFLESNDTKTLSEELFEEVDERKDRRTVIQYLQQYKGAKQAQIVEFANSLE